MPSEARHLLRNGHEVPRRSAPRDDSAAAATPPPELTAWVARCRYVDDKGPGIRRKTNSKDFHYFAADGNEIADAATLARIRSLAIPPAWTDVWICPIADGHLQATGRDAKGRKQYRYHPRFREAREETKFERALAFARLLPKIRRQVDRDLKRPGLPRDKVMATLVRLLEITLIRIGNDEYARSNGSFGLATMRGRHVDVAGSKIAFRFRGKSGKTHEVNVTDARVARILQRCAGLPGEELFQYLDENGEPRSIEAADVNEYLRRVAGEDFSTKDFRTWAGTVLALEALRRAPADTVTARQRALTEVVRQVASRLGNTPAVCRKCYIHPAVTEAYLAGQLDRVERALRAGKGTARGLSAPEVDLTLLLSKSLERTRSSPSRNPRRRASA
jgi:DNA topoisomerase I